MMALDSLQINTLLTKDLEFNVQKSLKTVADNASIEQRLWIRLNTNKGEDMFDINLGVPWFELLDNQATPEQIAAAVRTELQNDEYVGQVVYVNVGAFDKSIRSLSLSFQVILTNGTKLKSEGVVNI
jgi:phage baseplate assembly protein W